MSANLLRHKKLPINLGDRTFRRTALALAVPVALQNMLSASFSLIDTLMVGQLGEIALSSVGMAAQWSWLMTMVIFGISSGAAVFVSQYWGDKNTRGIHKTLGIAVISAAAISAVFALIALLFSKTVISVFNQDAAVIESGSLYLRYACFSYPAIALTGVLSSVLRSTEKVRLPMAVSGVSTVLNAVMNYLLIFPAGLGVKGAAIATVISSWVGLILIIIISLVQKNILIGRLHDVFSIKSAEMKEFFGRAAPVMFNETMWGLGTVTYSAIFANLGYEQYAAITIVRTFENISFCFFIGLCESCCVMIGKSVGSGQIREAIRDTKRFLILMGITSAIVGISVICLRGTLVSIFNLGQQVSPETLEIAKSILVIYGIWISVRNIPYISVVGIFRPGGDTTTGMKWEVVILWLFAIPMTFIAAHVIHLPFLAVYVIMYLCEDLPKGIVFLIHYVSGKWLKPVTQSGRVALEQFKAQE